MSGKKNVRPDQVSLTMNRHQARIAFLTRSHLINIFGARLCEMVPLQPAAAENIYEMASKQKAQIFYERLVFEWCTTKGDATAQQAFLENTVDLSEHDFVKSDFGYCSSRG